MDGLVPIDNLASGGDPRQLTESLKLNATVYAKL